MSIINDYDIAMLKFCHKIYDCIPTAIAGDYSGQYCSLKIDKLRDEYTNFARSECYIAINNNDTLHAMRIMAINNISTKNIKILLDLHMKPPKKGRTKFKERLFKICKKERLQVREYIFSIEKSYHTLDFTQVIDEISPQINALETLYKKMQEIRQQLLA